ncbi:unnamed protein product [Bursaphelenchus xylophilus]|uniref:(pine wood nematode) hypothetical protein n=1 Tax=Bursaphelenchus xylophilus TaxID=6326 RepID=A0A1I7S229_BURXY|nr:unnamed protein product [Bursaphelenchus xylophilus]CAG9114982.1 unnamed protein product [Bursaphelenchus xylophilus]
MAGDGFVIGEGICSFLQVVLNVLYLRKFWKLETFHANFRQTFIGLNVILSMSSLFHPTSEILEHIIYYRLFPGFDRPLNTMKLFCLFVDHIAVVFLHLKFFILAFERHHAIKMRGRYENEKGNMAIKVLGVLVVVVSIEIAIKTWLFCKYDTEVPYDVRLEKGMGVTKSPAFLSFSYILFSISIIVGFVLIRQTKGYIRKLRLKSQSLAESFELSQTNKIAEVIWPMLLSYIACGIACGPTAILCFHLALFKSSESWEKAYVVGAKANYFFLSCYTLFSLFFAFYKFGMIRKLRVTPMPVIRPTDEQKTHFDFLGESWKL